MNEPAVICAHCVDMPAIERVFVGHRGRWYFLCELCRAAVGDPRRWKSRMPKGSAHPRHNKPIGG